MLHKETHDTRPAVSRGVRLTAHRQLLMFTCKRTDKLGGGVSPPPQIYGVYTVLLPCTHACPRGGNTWEGKSRRTGKRGGVFVYSKPLWPRVYPQVTCCNLCVNTAEMIFPELTLARSQTRFQEMVMRGTRNIQCFQIRGAEIMNVERGCGVHVTVGCDPFPLQVIHMSIKLYLYHTHRTQRRHM